MLRYPYQLVTLVLFAFSWHWVVSDASGQTVDWKEFRRELLEVDDATREKKLADYIGSTKTKPLDKAKALNFMARSASRMGLLDEAEEFVRLAHSHIDPSKNKLVLRSLYQAESLIAAMKHEYERSIKLATKSIDLSEEIEPNGIYLVFPLNERGIAYQQSGKYTDAIKDYQRALKLSGNNQRLERFRIHLLTNLAATFNELKAFEKAGSTYQEALELSRKFKDKQAEVLLLINLGNNFLDLGNYQKGFSQYQLAKEIKNKNKDILPNGHLYVGLGDVANHDGEHKKAERYFKKAQSEYRAVNDTAGERIAVARLAEINKSKILKAQQESQVADNSALDEQIALLTQQLKDARKSEDLLGRKLILQKLIEFQITKKDWESATKLTSELMATRQTEFDEISRLSVATLDDKNSAIDQLNASNQRLWFSLVAILIGFGLIGLLWKTQIKVKQNLQLATAAKRQEQLKNSILQEQLSKKQKDAGLATMSAGVLHDFNNYLTAIISSAEIGIEARNVSDKDEYLSAILASGLSAAELTQQIHDFVGAGRPRKSGSCCVNDLLEAHHSSWASLVENKIGFSVNSDHVNQILIPIDANQLDRIIINLIKNASEAIKDAGTIEITAFAANEDWGACAHGEFCRIDVIDDGPGMSDEVIRCAQDPYYSTKGIGRGLGLSTVKGIVERNQGKSRIESSKNDGTTVSMLFPRISVAEFLRHHTPTNHFATPHITNTSSSGKRLLIVEDDTTVLSGLESYLQSAGFLVSAFEDAYQAIQFIENATDPIDVAITDFALSQNISGKEMAMVVKNRFPGCKALLISGYAEDEVFENSLFDGFLAKPFTLSQLRTKIGTLLVRSDAANTT